MSKMICYGYRYDADGKHSSGFPLEDQHAVIRFIKENLETPQLIITDEHDRQLLVMRDGIDFFNELERIGISLPDVFEQIHAEQISGSAVGEEKPEWEVLYDSIGLSPGEIRMRQRVKGTCLMAQIVGDVAEAVRGTYFDVHFLSSDGLRWCRFFNQDDCSATLMIKDKSGRWVDDPDPIYLSPDAKVKHLRSSEDTHTFLLSDL